MTLHQEALFTGAITVDKHGVGRSWKTPTALMA